MWPAFMWLEMWTVNTAEIFYQRNHNFSLEAFSSVNLAYRRRCLTVHNLASQFEITILLTELQLLYSLFLRRVVRILTTNCERTVSTACWVLLPRTRSSKHFGSETVYYAVAKLLFRTILVPYLLRKFKCIVLHGCSWSNWVSIIVRWFLSTWILLRIKFRKLVCSKCFTLDLQFLSTAYRKLLSLQS
jgi:hypothetical protein